MPLCAAVYFLPPKPLGSCQANRNAKKLNCVGPRPLGIVEVLFALARCFIPRKKTPALPVLGAPADAIIISYPGERSKVLRTGIPRDPAACFWACSAPPPQKRAPYQYSVESPATKVPRPCLAGGGEGNLADNGHSVHLYIMLGHAWFAIGVSTHAWNTCRTLRSSSNSTAVGMFQRCSSEGVADSNVAKELSVKKDSDDLSVRSGTAGARSTRGVFL